MDNRSKDQCAQSRDGRDSHLRVEYCHDGEEDDCRPDNCADGNLQPRDYFLNAARRCVTHDSPWFALETAQN
jgi:hypothetical protein